MLSSLLGAELTVSLQFCIGEWWIYYLIVSPFEFHSQLKDLFCFSEDFTGSNSSTALMTFSNLHHQKLFRIENVLGWPSSNKSSPYIQPLFQDYISDVPVEFGISIYCVKHLDSLEFRTFNFQVQPHLLAMGSLTMSTNLFNSDRPIPYPVFWNVYKHPWDACCRQNIWNSGLTLEFGNGRTRHYSCVDAL